MKQRRPSEYNRAPDCENPERAQEVIEGSAGVESHLKPLEMGLQSRFAGMRVRGIVTKRRDGSLGGKQSKCKAPRRNKQFFLFDVVLGSLSVWC